jgi:aminoglycoside 6'-N-acetyltransferase I
LIRKATLEDVPQLVSLAIQMWKSHTVEDLTKIFCEHIRKGKNIIFCYIRGTYSWICTMRIKV